MADDCVVCLGTLETEAGSETMFTFSSRKHMCFIFGVVIFKDIIETNV